MTLLIRGFYHLKPRRQSFCLQGVFFHFLPWEIKSFGTSQCQWSLFFKISSRATVKVTRGKNKFCNDVRFSCICHSFVQRLISKRIKIFSSVTIFQVQVQVQVLQVKKFYLHFGWMEFFFFQLCWARYFCVWIIFFLKIGVTLFMADE